MRLTELALRRPIAVTMTFLALVLIGVLSWQRLPLELMPNLNYPQLTIVTSCENMAPLEMEPLVTKVVEAAVGTVAKMRKISSLSREGLSLVTLDFEWGTNMNYAALDVREKLDQIKDILPREVHTPLIIRFDPESLPVLILAVQADSLDIDALQHIVGEQIKREIERESGVASARLSGGREREIRVAIALSRLAAQEVSLTSLLDALKDANLNFPGGKITRRQQELRLRTLGEFKELKDIGQVGLPRPRQRQPLFIRELGEVQDTFKEEQTLARLNGKPSLLLTIFKMADANTLEVVNRVKTKVASLNQEYQGKLHLNAIQDQGQFIQQAISQLQEAMLLGALLAFGVLLGFLANLRSALVIVTAIPIAILSTFSLMYLSGISLNMMSLGGLALGVGMLVDNGVVVLENIRRHQEAGQLPAADAIVLGTNEVKMAITASTLAHIVVFVPIIFVRGMAGQFLTQIALTISFSLLASLAVALILNPMLVSLAQPGSLARSTPLPALRWAATLQTWLDNHYAGWLSAALRRERLVGAAAIGSLLLGTLIYLMLGKELFPTLDQRQFLLRVRTPGNFSFAATDDRLRQVEDILQACPAIKTVITQLGFNPKEEYEKLLHEKEPRVGQIAVILKPPQEYAASANAVLKQLRPALDQVPDTTLEYIFPHTLGQWWGQRVELPELLMIQGPDLEVLAELSQQVLERLKGIRGLYDLETGLKKYGDETRIVLDRERAAAFGLSIKDIGDTLKIAIQGEVATQFRQGDRDVDIRVQLLAGERQSLPDLSRLFIYSKSLRADIPLQAVARFETGAGLKEIHRRDQVRTISLRGNIIGRSLGDCQDDIDRELSTLPLPEGYTWLRSSEALELQRSFRNLAWALLLAIVLVYMILAGQFESLWQPLIILAAIPFAFIGVTLILLLTGWGLSLGVYFGAIMLGGIVVNNSILLVDYINTLRQRGTDLSEAVLLGSRTRLRPVVMTTLTTILGLLPMALGRGEGSELRIPLALTVIGGLSASTVLTLILVPILYRRGEMLRDLWISRPAWKKG